MTGAAPTMPAGPGPLGRWDARCRIVALFLLAFAISSLSSPQLLPLAVAVVATFAALSAQPPRQLARRLRYPSLVVLAPVVLLPFVTGTTPAATLGPLTASREGLEAALLIAVRFYCIVTLTLVLLGAAPLLVNIRALRALGLPEIVADMALLTARHIEVHAEDLRRMRSAMRLRGHDMGRFSRRNLPLLAWLTGSLLLRSHERSERVYKAMRLRGYGAERRAATLEFRAGPRDLAGLAVAGLLAALLLGLELAP